MRNRIWHLIAMLVIVSMALASCGPTEEEAEAHKACWIMSSVITDQGWTMANNRGRLYVEENVGIETAYIENISDFGASDVDKVIEDFIQSGCTIIVGTSFGYTEAIAAKAAEHPDVFFLNESHFIPGDNIQSHWVRFYEGFFLTGLLAGSMTESDIVGVVATYPIPELLRRLNGFGRGVQEVNPDAVIKVVWLNSWYDPPKEREAAESLIAAGADVVQHLAGSPASLQAAQDAGILSISYVNDQSEFGPDASLGAMAIEWGPMLTQSIQKIIDGTWEAGTYWFGVDIDIVGALLTDLVPQDVQDLIADYKQQVIDGEYQIWAGPMYSQDGTLKIPDGEVFSEEDITEIDWLLQGMEGTIPSMD